MRVFVIAGDGLAMLVAVETARDVGAPERSKDLIRVAATNPDLMLTGEQLAHLKAELDGGSRSHDSVITHSRSAGQTIEAASHLSPFRRGIRPSTSERKAIRTARRRKGGVL